MIPFRRPLQWLGFTAFALFAGSGTLSAMRIGGSVKIGGKGSGALNVAHVGSDLIVGEKGSGLIRYEDIRGKVAVPQRR